MDQDPHEVSADEAPKAGNLQDCGEGEALPRTADIGLAEKEDGAGPSEAEATGDPKGRGHIASRHHRATDERADEKGHGGARAKIPHYLAPPRRRCQVEDSGKGRRRHQTKAQPLTGAGEENGFFDALANGPVAASDPAVTQGTQPCKRRS